MTVLNPDYAMTLMAFAAMASLMLLQVLIADVAGIRAGHVPGSPVTADHGNFLFRASRTVANTNETIGVFILAGVAAISAGAEPAWTGYAAWVYVAARLGYAGCYYGDIRIARSVVFAFSLLALIAMTILAFAATFS